MKNNSPLPLLGLMVCLSVPVGILLNLLNSPVRNNFATVLLNTLCVPLALFLMLGAVWGVWGSGYGWQGATEEERAAFLKREQTRVNNERKSRILAFALLLLVSVTATLIYGFHWLWKPPALSLPLFVGTYLIFYLFATVALVLWLKMGDGKLRASRTQTPEAGK